MWVPEELCCGCSRNLSLCKCVDNERKCVGVELLDIALLCVWMEMNTMYIIPISLDSAHAFKIPLFTNLKHGAHNLVLTYRVRILERRMEGSHGWYTVYTYLCIFGCCSV